jgi:uncharacterized protein YndB with AHSA1/START domain
MTETIQAIEIERDIEIAAPMDIVFETVLEQLGPFNEDPDEKPMPMKLEAWPGGRWFRDFGNHAGHCWGYVQSIRPHDLLEIHGPMFMSAPAISHVLFRLKEENGVTRIRFSHRAIGQIPPEHLDGGEANKGWSNFFAKASKRAQQNAVKGA